jgi:hypothetical protein
MNPDIARWLSNFRHKDERLRVRENIHRGRVAAVMSDERGRSDRRQVRANMMGRSW